MTESELTDKLKVLDEALESMQSVIVAFSGGVDSSFLAKAAYDALGNNATAMTADSPSLARSELEDARDVARLIGIRHEVIGTNELANPNYAENPINRCYFCKTELYTHLEDARRQREINFIANGLNLDDLGDFRPGNKAAEEFKVRAPLLEARLTKAEIRERSMQLGLPTYDKPAMPCLSSRIQFGTAITPEKLRQVESAEAFVRAYGAHDLRVRHMGEVARVEADPGSLGKISEHKEEIEGYLKSLGFTNVEFQQYRRGSLLTIK